MTDPQASTPSCWLLSCKITKASPRFLRHTSCTISVTAVFVPPNSVPGVSSWGLIFFKNYQAENSVPSHLWNHIIPPPIGTRVQHTRPCRKMDISGDQTLTFHRAQELGTARTPGRQRRWSALDCFCPPTFSFQLTDARTFADDGKSNNASISTCWVLSLQQSLC